jgi:hypothetical protein
MYKVRVRHPHFLNLCSGSIIIDWNIQELVFMAPMPPTISSQVTIMLGKFDDVETRNERQQEFLERLNKVAKEYNLLGVHCHINAQPVGGGAFSLFAKVSWGKQPDQSRVGIMEMHDLLDEFNVNATQQLPPL